MLRIVRHRKVKRDLLRIYCYLGERSMDVAERFLRAVNDDLKRLAEMPNIGSLRESSNANLEDVRSLPVSGFRNYLIFYQSTATELQMLRVALRTSTPSLTNDHSIRLLINQRPKPLVDRQRRIEGNVNRFHIRRNRDRRRRPNLPPSNSGSHARCASSISATHFHRAGFIRAKLLAAGGSLRFACCFEIAPPLRLRPPPAHSPRSPKTTPTTVTTTATAKTTYACLALISPGSTPKPN